MVSVEIEDFPTLMKTNVLRKYHGLLGNTNHSYKLKIDDNDFAIAYNNSSVAQNQSDEYEESNIGPGSTKQDHDSSPCSLCLPVSIAVLSIFIILCGFGFFVAGCVMQFGVGWIAHWTEDSILKPGAKDSVEALNIYLDKNETEPHVLRKMTNLIQSGLPNYTVKSLVSLVTVGLLTVVFTMAGLLGICCKSRIMLIVYVIYLACHILGNLTVIIVYYVDTKHLAEKGRVALEQIIRKEFVGILSSEWNVETVFLTVTQFWLGCCGIHNGEEYKHAAKMTKNMKSSKYTGPDLKYPVSCCNEIAVTKCVTGNHASNSNHNVGCWSTLEEKITPIIMYAAIGTGIFAFIQLCTLILVIILLCCMHRRRKFSEQNGKTLGESTSSSDTEGETNRPRKKKKKRKLEVEPELETQHSTSPPQPISAPVQTSDTDSIDSNDNKHKYGKGDDTWKLKLMT